MFVARIFYSSNLGYTVSPSNNLASWLWYTHYYFYSTESEKQLLAVWYDLASLQVWPSSIYT